MPGHPRAGHGEVGPPLRQYSCGLPPSSRAAGSHSPHRGSQPFPFALVFLTSHMVASFGSLKLELGNQMPLVETSRGPLLRGGFHLLLLLGNELRFL